MFCNYCGKHISNDSNFCPYCGHELKDDVFNSTSNTNITNEDTGNIGWAFLGYLVPIAGLILFLIWNKEQPKNARKAGLGALISVIVNLLLVILSVLFSFYFVYNHI